MSTIIRSVKNITSNTIFIPLGNISLLPNITVDLYTLVTDDVLSSLQAELQGMVTRGSIQIISTENSDELLPIGISDEQTDILALITQVSDLNDSKSLKVNLITTSDVVSSNVQDAPIQSSNYVQTDVQAIADLANDLKEKLSFVVSLTNELKAKINSMNNF